MVVRLRAAVCGLIGRSRTAPTPHDCVYDAGPRLRRRAVRAHKRVWPRCARTDTHEFVRAHTHSDTNQWCSGPPAVCSGRYRASDVVARYPTSRPPGGGTHGDAVRRSPTSLPAALASATSHAAGATARGRAAVAEGSCARRGCKCLTSGVAVCWPTAAQPPAAILWLAACRKAQWCRRTPCGRTPTLAEGRGARRAARPWAGGGHG